MKTKPWALLLLLLCSTTSPADTVTVSDSGAAALWERARAATGSSTTWISGRTVMTMEFLDRHGDVDEVMKVLVTTTASENGLVMETTELETPGGLIGAIMSGDAVGPDGITGASSGAESGEDGGGADPVMTDPFLPEVQDSLRIGAAVDSGVVEDVRSSAFPIGWESTDGTVYTGQIWLADDSSRPVLLEVTGDSYNDSVRSIAVAIGYGPHGAVVLPSWSISEMEFRFALVIKVRIRVVLEFSDYFENGDLS